MVGRHADFRSRFVLRSAVSATLVVLGAPAESIELVNHNGFEACWSQALAPAQFTDLFSPALDGAPGCIPEHTATSSTDASFCNATTCAGGATGCPVVLRGGQHIFATGTPPDNPRVDGWNGIDPFSTLVTFPAIGECTVSFVDTSTVQIGYGVNYRTIADGNNGAYTWDLGMTNTTVTGLGGGDFTIGGSNILCLSTNIDRAYFTAMIAGVEQSIADTLRPATLDRSICPPPQ
jgi:hypothetical protein